MLSNSISNAFRFLLRLRTTFVEVDALFSCQKKVGKNFWLRTVSQILIPVLQSLLTFL